MSDLRTVVKAHDIRGLVPEQSDEAACVALGVAFVSVVGAVRIVVGRDMRASSLSLSAAFAASACGWGAEVLDVGLAFRPACSPTPAVTSACPQRCSRPATIRPPTTASSCAVRERRRSAGTPAWQTLAVIRQT